MLYPAAILALVLGTNGSVQGEQKVTYSCAAIPVSSALDALSKSAGVVLHSEDPISRELIVLRFKDVPLKAAMDRIAYAATGEWVKTNDGFNLTRPTPLVHQIEHDERLARLGLIRKALGARIKSLTPFDLGKVQAYFDAMRFARDRNDEEGIRNFSMNQKVMVVSPSERFATRVLSVFDPETLADLQSGQRTVFSTAPTHMQRPLGSGVFQACDQYALEQNAWNKISAQSRPRSRVVPANDGSELVFSVDSQSRPDQGIKGTPAKVLAIMTADWDSGEIEVQFKICDTQGRIFAYPNTTIALSDSGSPQDGDEDQPSEPSPRPAQAATVRLSPIAQELAKYYQGSEEEGQDFSPSMAFSGPVAGANRKFSSELRAFVLDPERHEPLSLFPAEPLLSAADAAGADVALCVDDPMFRVTAIAGSSADTMLSELSGRIEGARYEKGWFVGRPLHPLHPVIENRHGLGEFLRGASKAGRARLKDLMGYAQYVPDYNVSLGIVLIDLAVPNDGAMQQANSDWLYIRLLGSLSQTQRSVLDRDSYIKLSFLNPDQIETVGQIVYGKEADAEPQEVGGANEDATMLVSNRMMLGSLASEPTEVLPNGLNMSMVVKMTTETKPALLATYTLNGEDCAEQVIEPESVAMTMMESDLRQLWQGIDQQEFKVAVKGYRTAAQRTLNMTITLPGRCSDSATLTDTETPTDAVGGIDKLPADMRKEIEEHIDEMKKLIEEYRKNPPKMPIQGGGGSVPPPLD